jgi:hypothetical protein
MTDDERKAAEEHVADTLGMIEATAGMADTMDAMKRALEDRGWSTPMSEHVGAQLGVALFTMIPGAGRGRRK